MDSPLVIAEFMEISPALSLLDTQQDNHKLRQKAQRQSKRAHHIKHMMESLPVIAWQLPANHAYYSSVMTQINHHHNNQSILQL